MLFIVLCWPNKQASRVQTRNNSAGFNPEKEQTLIPEGREILLLTGQFKKVKSSVVAQYNAYIAHHNVFQHVSRVFVTAVQ